LQHTFTSCSPTKTQKALLCALSISILGSLFIYLAYFNLDIIWLNSIAGLLSLYLLLQSNAKVWFWSGFFFGLFWFWWIGLSFIHYHMLWAIPFVVIAIALIYGGLFWFIAKTALILSQLVQKNKSVAPQRIPSLFTIHYSLFTLSIKALGLLMLSYIHPFTFDWFKPELMFVESYFGVAKWQFGIILLTLVMVITTRKPLFLVLLVASYTSVKDAPPTLQDETLSLVTTYTPVEEKWNERKHPAQFKALFQAIQNAIDENRTAVVLPESVFPLFLNRNDALMSKLKNYATQINIVTGGLYWDGQTPRNTAYIFTKEGKVTVANKVLLVPFGESNPLPDLLSDWVNKVFYDDAVDYQASTDVVDYTLDKKRYRNAICFEATSEKLYEGRPKRMIALSNNGWFTPSIEPTLQRLLLQYYSIKYGTTIYHAVNMSPSYIIIQGRVNFL